MNASGAVPNGSARAAGWLALAAPLFDRLLDRMSDAIREGAIEATLPGGRTRVIGGTAPGPVAVITIVSWRALLRLASGGSVGWYEAWTHGEWTSPDPTVIFEVFVRNRHALGDTGRAGGLGRLARRILHLARRNTRTGARRNIVAHYDLGNDFYAGWLDPTMSYSSARFADPIDIGESMEQAQHRKLSAMLDRTETVSGDRILEIGCGWGAFVEVAAQGGRRVHAITISPEQQRAVSRRIVERELAGAEVSLTDYRDVTGSYDAVVSIEMVEAVGRDFWPDYLAAIARALRPGGRAAIQYIAIDDAIFDRYARNVDFIQAYIFPGGMLLSEPRFRALADAAGLDWVDQDNFGGHYAETLRRWRTAFDRVVDNGLLPGKFDSKFVALWRYYLMYCEGGFRGGGIDVAQVTLVKR